MNSFQLKMKAKTPAAINPGADTGIAMYKNACNLEAPSTLAACSRYIRLPSKNEISIHARKGNEMVI